MDTRQMAKELRLSYWAGLMRERKQNGLSIKAFCKQIGISYKTYYYWQRKLREAACQELLAHTQAEPAPSDNSSVPVGWAVCEVSSGNKNTLTIEIGGCRVLAADDTAPELLAKTCKVLLALC